MDTIEKLIKAEEERQVETVTLIPSENYASRAVRAAVGSGLNNKYSEGYIGKRYYQGNKIIDEIEQIAIERTKQLFGVPFANVQPYSGSPANGAIQMALVKPGEKIMGMKLSAGGHLTHGHPAITFSGRFFQSVQYDVTEDGFIDYDELEQIAVQEKPKLLIVGTTAYPRKFDFKRCGEIADKCGAFFLADISHIAGLIVAGEHPSPVQFADVVMTTTHKTLRGPRGAIIMTTEKGINKLPDLNKMIDRAVFPGLQGGPHDGTTAGIAIALEEASRPEFKEYGKQIVKNMTVLATELTAYGFKLVTGGSDNHLAVLDLRNKNISGKDAAVKLEEAGIVVNANSVPHDTNPPMKPSGIRLGTPAVTTRKMKEAEMIKIAGFINTVLSGKTSVVGQVNTEIKELCGRYPIWL